MCKNGKLIRALYVKRKMNILIIFIIWGSVILVGVLMALATKRMLPTKMQEAYDLALPKPSKWWFWAGVFVTAHGAYNLTTSLIKVIQ